jgi:adenine-specific DNA-methyltransferase
MDKLKMHSPDQVEAKLDRLAELFPGCVVESRDEITGNTIRAVDFDRIRQEVSGRVVEGPRERFHLDWPGKREARLAANTAVDRSLRPQPRESLGFECASNLFIEGDNLEALKLLRESYLGKIKLIYIDPPYNTGSNLIYSDSFDESPQAYASRSGQTDATGGRLVSNFESNGRFHSDWLSMMMPRLMLARQLLTDDGVIAVSIDDNEIGSLTCLMDEVFGPRNRIVDFVWQTKAGAKGVPPLAMLTHNHEYILLYARNASAFSFKGRPRDALAFSNPDGDPRGPWKKDNMKSTVAGAEQFDIVDPATKRVFTARWAFSKATIERMISEGKVIFPERADGSPMQKSFLHEYRNENIPLLSLLGEGGFGGTEAGAKDLEQALGSRDVFSYPKPTGLLKFLVQQIAKDKDDVVMDFFAGSGTLGEAVLEANQDDGVDRRFILVQIAESLSPTEPRQRAAAEFCRSLGKPATVAELSKERLRRAFARHARKVTAGFRALVIDSSSVNEVPEPADSTSQRSLIDRVSNLKVDRTAHDLLFHVLVLWGVDLSLPIEERCIMNKTVFIVDGNALAACFDDSVDEALVRELAKLRPLRAVFRDGGYASDSTKINVEQIFKLLSPETEVRSL